MSDEIIKMDALKKKVEDRIRATIAELIPEAQWKLLVEREVKAYMEKDLPNQVHGQIEEIFKEKIKEELKSICAPSYSRITINGVEIDRSDTRNSKKMFT